MAATLEAEGASRGLIAASLVLSGILGGHVALDSSAIPADESLFATLVAGSGAPTLSHLLIAAPAVLALVMVLIRRRAVSVPFQVATVFISTLIGLVWGALLFSSYRATAFVGAIEWTGYAAAFLAIVASGGRAGGVLLVRALFLSAVVASILGLRQFGEVRVVDPTFRVQGGWNNPNALGAFLVIGVFAGLAQIGTAERVIKLLGVVALTLVLAALALTGSKGAVLALAIGAVTWIGALVAFRSSRWRAEVGALVAAAVLALLLVATAARSATSTASSANVGSGAAARALSGGSEGTQSFAFRRLLWRSALVLARTEPASGGINSFGPRSTKPGLVTQTILAHSTPLQLAAEATPLGGVAFVAFFGAVVVCAARGARSLSPERKSIVAAGCAGLAAALVHNFVDSDAYFFGLGVAIFSLAGIVLTAASDATVAELVPRPFRLMGAGLGVLLLAMWSYVGAVDLLAARARGTALSGDRTTALDAARSLAAIAPHDPRPFALLALVEPDPAASLAAARRAYRLAPSPKAARAVANLLLRAGDPAGAIAAAEDALRLDPNNFAALALARDAALSMGDAAAAEAFARRTVAIEGTSYEAIRSQPEFVPTAIAEARLFLADRESDAPVRADERIAAIRDLALYARTTVPVIARAEAAEPGTEIAGESVARAETMITLGREAIARAVNDLPRGDQRRTELAEAGAAFDAAEAALRRASSAR